MFQFFKQGIRPLKPYYQNLAHQVKSLINDSIVLGLARTGLQAFLSKFHAEILPSSSKQTNPVMSFCVSYLVYSSRSGSKECVSW